MSTGIDRRTFLKLFGLGTAAMVPACTDAPVEQLYAYLTPPREMVPGVPTWVASVCRDCPAGCGIHVKLREARPIKLEGNPECPVNAGRLCPRGQSALQALYAPNRLLTAQVGDEPDARVEVDPAAAAAWCAERLEAARSQGKSIALLTGLEAGSAEVLHAAWAGAFGARHHSYEPLGFEALRAATQHLFGLAHVPRFDLGGADMVVGLGAELVESWQSPVEHARQLASAHGFEGGQLARLVHVGPRRGLTGTSFDEWIPVAPGTEGLVALALVHHLLATAPPALPGPELAAIRAMVASYAPATVASQAGVDEAALVSLAEALAGASAPVVLPPGLAATRQGATFDHAATLLLDYVLGAIGTRVHLHASNPWSRCGTSADVLALLDQARAGEVGVLVLVGRNPMYELPGDVASALSKVGTIVQITDRPDESGAFAHAVLPATHFLESWGDYEAREDWYGLLQPARTPDGDRRQAEDWLLALAAAAGRPLPWKDFRQCLAQRWAGLQQLAAPLTSSVRFFEQRLAQGGWRLRDDERAVLRVLEGPPPDEPVAEGEEEDSGGSASWPPPIALMATALPQAGDPPTGTVLLAYPSLRLYDGRSADRPWIQETPDSLVHVVWDTALEVSRELAAAQGLADGDRVRVTGSGNAIEASVRVLPTLAPGVVAMPLGGGRTVGHYAAGLGVRVLDLLEPIVDEPSGALAFLQATVTVQRLAEGSLTTFEGSADMDDRPIALQVSLADALHDHWPVDTLHGEVLMERRGRVLHPIAGHGHGGGHGEAVHGDDHDEHGEAGHHGDEGGHHGGPGTHGAGTYYHPEGPELHHGPGTYSQTDRQPGRRESNNMYPDHDYPEHMWGLTVDLDLCNGCGACVVACYAENNIGVVGADGVQRGRELSWLQIHRYWVHSEREGRDVARYFPMMCQHCEAAPCEAVCPVFAPYHTRDGLNAQIYNRCVGTRYCSNNCPYKVRKFNYFPSEWPEALDQQLNPDVTVRRSGVMEKCTFCIQRIRGAVNQARHEGREVAEGEIVPACVQTCPTGAIRFGDRKREGSEVNRIAAHPRSYRLLNAYLNTRPAVAYLRKVDGRDRDQG